MYLLFAFLSLASLSLASFSNAQAEPVFLDDFDDGVLPGSDGVWELVPYDTVAPHWTATESGGALVVTDVHEAVEEEAWVQVQLHHRLDEGLADFDVVVDFAWDSADPVTGIDDVQACQDIFLTLHDTAGVRIAWMGLWDAWYSQPGQALSDVAGVRPDTLPGLPLAGSGRVHVWREGDQLSAGWGEGVAVTTTNEQPLGELRLVFAYAWHDGGADVSHFGTAWIDRVAVDSQAWPPTADTGDGGAGDGGVPYDDTVGHCSASCAVPCEAGERGALVGLFALVVGGLVGLRRRQGELGG